MNIPRIFSCCARTRARARALSAPRIAPGCCSGRGDMSPFWEAAGWDVSLVRPPFLSSVLLSLFLLQL